MNYQYVDNTQQLRTLLGRIFSDDFMQQHTSFPSLYAFQASSAVIVNWQAPQLIYAPQLLDAFVRESTQFSCWEEMVRCATDQCFGS